MSVLGELLVQINGDNSGLQKSLAQSSKTAGDVANEIVGKLGGVALAYKAVQAAIDGINYNAMKEQAEIAFGVFLGSAEKAKDMIKSLQQVAIDTPLQFADVRDAGKQLLAYGVAAEDLVPTIKTLTDVSAGLNIPIKDLSYLYGTIKTTGRAATVDLNQFAGRGIPIWEELAKVTGKNGTELRKMVEAGQIGFPQIEKAFSNMTSEGGKFYQMAVKQMDSFTGAQSNLSDATGIYLSNLTAGMMGPIKEGMMSITKSMNEATTSSQEFGSSLGNVFKMATSVAGPLFNFLSQMPGEFTAIGISAAIAFAVFGPWGAAIAAIVVGVGALGKVIDDANAKNMDHLTKSFLSIAEHSKMSAQQTTDFLYAAKGVEDKLGNWNGSMASASAYFKRTADWAGITAEQVANIAINSDTTTAKQKETAQLYLKQNGLTAIGIENSKSIVEFQKQAEERAKATGELWEKQHPKEAAAAKARAQADKDAAQADKDRAAAQKTLIDGHNALSGKIAAIDALQKASKSDEKVALEEKIKLRDDYLSNLNKEYLLGKVNIDFMTSETKALTEFQGQNLESIKNIDMAKASVILKDQDMNSISSEYLHGLIETGVTLNTMGGLFDMNNLKLTTTGKLVKVVADATVPVLTNLEKTRIELEKIGMGKLFDTIIAESEDWNGRLLDIYKGVKAVWKDGFEKIGASLVTGKGDWEGWAAAADKAIASVLEGLGAQLAAMAVGKALMQEWAGAALAAAGSVAAYVAAGAINAYADQLTQVASSAGDVSGNTTTAATAVDMLTAAIQRGQAVLSAKSDTTSALAQATEQTNAIKNDYKNRIAIIKDGNLSLAGLSKMSESDIKRYGLNTYNDAISLLEQQRDIALSAGNYAKSSTIQRDIDDLLAKKKKLADDLSAGIISELNSQMQADIDALGYATALFQQRADEAGSTISSAFTDALKNGTSEADFTKSIMDMLRKMAIDAAILAGGYAKKFKDIGSKIAEALKDGLSSVEITSIKDELASLYTSAQKDISTINELLPATTATTPAVNAFNPGYAVGTNYAPGGLSLVGERGAELMNVPRGAQIFPATQTRRMLEGIGSGGSSKGDTNISIQSNAPLDPIQTARMVQQTMESMAFAGVA